MPDRLGDAKIPIPCPKCGHKIQQPIARLQNKTPLVCPSCRSRINLLDGAGVKKQIRQADDIMEAFKRKLKKL